MRFLIFLIIFSMLFVGCLPEDSARSRLGQDPSSIDENSNTNNETENPFGSSSELNFFIGSDPLNNPTIPPDIANPIFLKGTTIINFFNSETNAFNNVYCLSLSFNNIIIDPNLGTQGSRQLRVRASAINFNDVALNQAVPIFQLEFNNQALNQASCAGTYDGFNSSNPGQVYYSAQSLCPTCATTIVADTMSIGRSQGNPLLLSSNTQLLNATSLSLNILSPNANSSGGTDSNGNPNSCTEQNCNQEGFCCSSETNACVQHSSVKPGFEGTTTLQEALTAIDNGSAQISSFPAIFHLCPGQSTTGGNNGSDGSGTSGTQTITQIQSDYPCAEEIRANATATPYQLFLSTTPNSCDPSVAGSCACNYDSTQSTEPLYYLNVLERLYSYCNCQGTTLEQKLSNCPTAFYYDVISQNADGLPTQVQCSAVEVPGFDPNVTISSKSVPHRFYSDSGQSINDLSTASQATVQEGDEFSYIGNNTIFPVNGSFNMNSILGSMSVDQQKALPAKAVNVVQGQSYIIRNEGNDSFIPCPTCGNDSWFAPFKAQPTSSIRGGFGLRAIGHTTRRDQQQFNSSLGNYEDTIFGRACFVPPTMLPFSHKQTGVNDVNDARRIRLETQAAMFINGYQRDWFGFNYGAIIGSFDGVSWFAIGTSRLVQATSDKLYLAFNAPFGDLTSPNLHNLTVEPFIPGSDASQYDYDPNAANNSLKNQAASCQQYHICKSDTDCITQLGWEYVCASATGRRTQWPRFNSTQEELNTSASRSIIGILQQGSLPSTDTNKRCVYRGAGSPCVVDPLDIADEQLRKSFTCANNFHCAAATSPSFNKEVSRFANPLAEISFLPGNHIYGQDANFLGRPLDYISSSLNTLPSIVASTLKENLLSNNTTTLTKVAPTAVVGLCRPGRDEIPLGLTISPTNSSSVLTTLNGFPQIDPLRSQTRQSFSNQADYISQIALARDQEYTQFRYMSCPVIDPEEGDLLQFHEKLITRDTSNSEFAVFMREYADQSIKQNMTGRESLALNSDSPFSSIEAPPLGINQLIATPTLVQNSCLRRAGAACHTDLDCGPNRLHGNLASLFNEEEFGNLAEKSFYQESLVCGQAERKPSPGTTRFDLFDIRKNKCCRDIGNDLTIYSSNTPNIEFQIDTKKPGFLFPQAPDRYSRLSSTDEELNTSVVKDPLNAIIELLKTEKQSQWKTIHSVAKRTCCGGGWVRKFSNGTHDWDNPVQVNFNPSQFKCLNYSTPFGAFEASELEAIYGVPTTITNSQRNLLCDSFAPGSGACVQTFFGAYDVDTVTPPQSLAFPGSLPSAYNFNEAVTHFQGNNYIGSPFNPYTALLGTVDPSKRRGLDANSADLFLLDPDVLALSYSSTQQIVNNIVLPLYIPRRGVRAASPSGAYEFEVHLFNQSSGSGTTNLDSNASSSESLCGYVNLTDSTTSGTILNTTGPEYTLTNAGAPSPNCSVKYDPQDNILTITVTTGAAASNSIRQDLYNGDTYAIGLKFMAPGSYMPGGSASAPGSVGVYDITGLGMVQGSPQFYLDRLSRMELAGIPQVFHEALYCTDNQVKLVPGLYNTEMYATNNLETEPDNFIDTNASTEFEVSNAYTSAATNFHHPIEDAILGANIETVPGGKFITSYKGLDTAPVFSEHEFACCHKLDTFAASENLCCSGYGLPSQAPGVLGVQCKLPRGADLNVYFNRYVSGESDGQELEDLQLALSDGDFLEHTGEPDMTKDTVRTKLQNLATQFCENGSWRMGSAFGEFYPQPNNSVGGAPPTGAFSIIDSPNDSAGNVSNISSSGNSIVDYQSFISGYKWNNHIYCDI